MEEEGIGDFRQLPIGFRVDGRFYKMGVVNVELVHDGFHGDFVPLERSKILSTENVPKWVLDAMPASYDLELRLDLPEYGAAFHHCLATGMAPLTMFNSTINIKWSDKILSID